MSTAPPEVLVIGYGNGLRGDDGIGPWVAGEVRARGWPGVRALALPQLTPELAELLAGVRLAVFVDAAWSCPGLAVNVRRVEPAPANNSLTHFGGPRELLGLAERLYGRAPEAWLVSVEGCEFGLSEQLSAAALRHGRLALQHIERLV
jgi:hydrogenase maturation protease